MFTYLIKHESDECRVCYRPQQGYFGIPSVRIKRNGDREVQLSSLCKICFEVDSAHAEAEANEIRFTEIGTGIDGIVCYNGDRCCCGAVTLVSIRHGMCIQCSKDHRMLTKMQAEKKFIDKLLKNLRAEIKSKAKELANAN